MPDALTYPEHRPPIFLATSSSPLIDSAMRDGHIGRLATPFSGNRVARGVTWGADSGAYTRGYQPDRYFRWLETEMPNAGRCLFAPAGDVVGDWPATLDLALPDLPRLRALGYPAAIVLQDGATPNTVPWDEIDAVFIGGTDAYKLGPQAAACVRAATARGLWAHMGRVNSGRRYAYAGHIGCGSVDGTFLSFGPDINLARLLRWEARRQPSLF